MSSDPLEIFAARLLRIEEALANSSASIAHLQSVSQALLQRLNPPSENEKHQLKLTDVIWACSKCSSRIGIYDPSVDVLRVKYKDFTAWITPGVGGGISIPCRRCSEMNSLEDTRKTAKVTEGL